MRRALLFLVLAGALLSPTGTGAQVFSASTDIQVVGGTAGVAAALGLVAPPQHPVFLPEMARHIYGAPEGKSADTDRLLDVLTSYLEDVDRFEHALAAVQPLGGTVSLGLAQDKNGRKRLNAFLNLLGLTLKERSREYLVETSGDKKAAGRTALLRNLGVEPEQIAHRLNAGDAIRLELKADMVPLPLDPAAWSVILDEKVQPTGLFARVMGDRRAALLAYGLAWMDDETSRYLSETPALLRKLYEDHAPVLAAFGRSIRVHGRKVAVPGGPGAEPLWERIVDEKVTRPDRFIRTLLDRHDGRLAYFYDAVANLDGPHARFALGLWIEDPKLRAERFEALASITRAAFEPLRPNIWPFTRPPVDVALMLARVRVQADGGPTFPNARKLWDKVFESPGIPDDPARELKNLQQDGAIDAAWLADRTMMPIRAPERAERLDTVVFAQRVFAAAPDTKLPDVLIALRGFGRFRTLMLTLDRIGATDPGLYADAVRRAVGLSEVSRDRAFPVLAQFQAALALIARARAVRSLDDTRARNLTRDLVAIQPVDGEYRGAIARWLDTLLQALPAAPDVDAEACMLQGLAGVRPERATLPSVRFEERSYGVDIPGAELRRLSEIRHKQGGYSLSQVLAFARAIRGLEMLDPIAATIADVRAAADALQQAGASFKADKIPPPPGVERPRDPQQVLAKELKDLRRINRPRDIKNARDSVAPLYEVADLLLARTLLSHAYALAIGDPGGTVLLGTDPARRHDFGLAETQDEARRRTPWLLPVEQLEAGIPWHLLGSALALDVGLARLGLRRISSDAAVEHHESFNPNDRRTFMESFVLLDSGALDDPTRDEIAAAITRGRARIAAATDAAALDALAVAVHTLAVDGLRRRALRWTLANQPGRVADWFSMTELALLGMSNLPPETLNAILNRQPGSANMDAWGMSGLIFDACLCTTLHADVSWQILAGQAPLGMVPANVADLNLRVLELAAEMRLPAVLAKPILSAAVQTLLDRANPRDPDDWMTLVSTAQRITREEVEDYMSALTANGTLVPVDSITR